MSKKEGHGPRKIEGVSGESMKKHGRNMARAMYQAKGNPLPHKHGGRGK
jgi:hypothetical protein